MRIVGAAVVLLLLMSSSANAVVLRAPAAKPRAVPIEAEIAAYVPIARSVYPTVACSEVSIGVSNRLRKDDGEPVVGLAWMDLCRVEFRRSLTGADLCRVVVHEFGHLAGEEHSLDVNSVMYDGPEKQPASVVPACTTAAEAVNRYPAATVAAWWLIDGMRRGTRVQCGHGGAAPTTVRCVVRDRWGKLKRWKVRVLGPHLGDVKIG